MLLVNIQIILKESLWPLLRDFEVIRNMFHIGATKDGSDKHVKNEDASPFNLKAVSLDTALKRVQN